MPVFSHPIEFWEAVIDDYIAAGNAHAFAESRGLKLTAARNMIQKARMKTGDMTSIKDIRRLAVFNAIGYEWCGVADVRAALKPQGFDVDYETVQRDVLMMSVVRGIECVQAGVGRRWRFRRVAA